MLEIVLAGSVTSDVSLSPFGNIFIRGYEILDTLTIETGASLTFENVEHIGGTNAPSPDAGVIEVEGTLTVNESFIASEINVRDGGEFNVNGSSAGGDWFFDAGSGGTIEDHHWATATKIHSDSTVEFKNNFVAISANKIEAVGDPTAVIDLSGQYWHMNDDQIPDRIVDQNDDPSRPTIAFQPTLEDSPENRRLVGTEGDDEFVVYVPLGTGRTVVTINDGDPREFSNGNSNGISFDGLGGNDKVVVTFEKTSDFEFVANLESTPELLSVSYFGIDAFTLERKVKLFGFEDSQVEFVADPSLSLSATFYDSTMDDEFNVNAQGVSLTNDAYSVSVKGVDDVTAFAEAGGADKATIRTVQDDSFIYRDGVLKQISEIEPRTVVGFEEAIAIAPQSSTGQLTLWGTDLDERFTLGRGWANLQLDSTLVQGFNFARVVSRGNGGEDTAFMFDSQSDDALFSRPGEAFLSNDNGNFGTALGFSNIIVRSDFGNDLASLDGSSSDEELFAGPDSSQLKSTSHSMIARGFSNVSVKSLGGDDSAFFSDSPSDDKFIGAETYSSIGNNDFRVGAVGFSDVLAKSTEGADVVHFSDSNGDDLFFATPTLARLTYSAGTQRTALGFPNTYVNATGGVDSAFFVDSEGDDVFVAKPGSALMRGVGFEHFAIGFGSNSATSNSGNDIARFLDSNGMDSLFANDVQTRLKGEGFNNFATGFQRNLIFSRGGNDLAFLEDSGVDDFLGAKDNDLWMFNDDYYRFIAGFESVQAGAVNGGKNLANVSDILFELDLFGDWMSS